MKKSSTQISAWKTFLFDAARLRSLNYSNVEPPSIM
jgi:hypothetical protein